MTIYHLFMDEYYTTRIPFFLKLRVVKFLFAVGIYICLELLRYYYLVLFSHFSSPTCLMTYHVYGQASFLVSLVLWFSFCSVQPHVDFGLKLLGADAMSIPGLYRFVQVKLQVDSASVCRTLILLFSCGFNFVPNYWIIADFLKPYS